MLGRDVEPGGRAAAPGRLRLVQLFLNTANLERGLDRLASADLLRDWLVEQDLLAPTVSVSRSDHRRAIAVREAIRALLLANNGAPLDLNAVDTLNAAARDANITVRFGGDGRAAIRPEASGVYGALGVILGAVVDAMADGSWERLKACRNDVCRWAFYDISKNRSGSWCTMAICGNRVKTRAFRRRQAQGGPRRVPLQARYSSSKPE
jgi:predicted RNA-binding Zn ribbon-like protein